MDNNHALIAFSALSQETRLQAFRLLVEHGLQGAPAGTLSDELDIPHNTLSFHLSHLSHAGLVTSERKGRLVIYKANFSAIQSLIGFMTENCCIREARDAGCCPPKKGKKK